MMSTSTAVEASLLEPTGDGAIEEARARRAYVELWPQRLEYLIQTLDSGDQRAALEAAVGLRTASQFVGAAAVAVHVRRLELELYHGIDNVNRQTLDDVRAVGAETLQAIHQHTSEPGSFGENPPSSGQPA